MPKEWEALFITLLPFMHGVGNYTPIPDVDGGDSGLEAYSHNGNAYQCFADQGSKTVKQRYEAQRDKINEDLIKFQDVKKILPLLGGQMIARWILIVPVADSKELVKYCQKKSKEIQALNLPYVAKQFRVEVRQEADLKGYLAQLTIASIKLPEPNVDPNEVEADIGIHLADLDAKLSKVYHNVATRAEHRNRLILEYAKSENYLQDLADSYPDTLNAVRSVINAQETRLLAIGPATGTSPRKVLEAELVRLLDSLNAEAPGLQLNVRMTLVLGAIANWLFRCPLRFDDVNS